MLRKCIFGYPTEKIIAGLLLLVVILALSTECRFQEPTILPGPADNLESITPIQHLINIDAYTLHKINNIIQEISRKSDLSKSDKLSIISEKFLGTPYEGNKLHGSDNIPEELIVDFRGLDCFTYLDYVVALQASHTQQEFLTNIVKTRYIDNEITFYKRKHFFTDWAHREQIIAEDITRQISPFAITTEKYLNKKNDGGKYINGLPAVSRNIIYIPGKAIDTHLVSKLTPGDLIGLYTPQAGLDVSHVGIFIMTQQGPVFRHASSERKNQRVVDSPLIPYLSNKPGIVVLRIKKQ